MKKTSKDKQQARKQLDRAILRAVRNIRPWASEAGKLTPGEQAELWGLCVARRRL